MLRTALVMALALSIGGCASADPRRAVAEQFIDRLFVVIDQNAARELASGLAIAKIDEETRLKQGQAIDDGTMKPQVSYRFLERKGGDADPVASLVYELRVRPQGADEFAKRLFLTVRREDGRWRVSNYTLESAPET